MLVKLSGRALRPLGDVSTKPFIGRIAVRPDLPPAARGREILRVASLDEVPPGFRAYLVTGPASANGVADSYSLDNDFHYLGDGDVVRIDPQRGAIHALYRRSSRFNTFLLTERCDNFCVMCSQPPKERDDSWLVDELEEVIPLISPETGEIGFSGGEPGLLGARLVYLVDRVKRFLPNTALHILSNGRAFRDEAFAAALSSVRHPDLMIGIPLYSSISDEHDYIVQARGAFDDTIRGILNLKRFGVPVEIRFVIHRETYRTLPSLATFIARNLLFVDHVALMGLEQMGFAKTNLKSIWVDPLDYQRELVAAAQTLDRAGLVTSIYNHQLCVLDESLHRFARQSISDWKNAFIAECDECTRREACGGFFASSTETRSRGIRPISGS